MEIYDIIFSVIFNKLRFIHIVLVLHLICWKLMSKIYINKKFIYLFTHKLANLYYEKLNLE